MKRFFKWVKRFLTGWYNVLSGKQSEEAKRRLYICMECDNKTRISKKDYFCNSCGCILRAKCASPEETCDLNKW